MDITALLAKASEEAYTENEEAYGDDDFEENLSPAEILKAAAIEISHDDKMEASELLKKEADKIVVREEEKAASTSSSRPSYQRDKDVSRDTYTIPTEAIKVVNKPKNNRFEDEDEDEESDHDNDPELQSELFIACYRGESRIVQKLLNSGANYFMRDRHGITFDIYDSDK